MTTDPGQVAVIALGSNLGDSQVILTKAMDRLRALSAEPPLVSGFYATAPVDCPPGSPDFLNAVAIIAPLPGETPETLLGKLQALEQEFGRKPKTVLNEPRPLDLDLISFGNCIRTKPDPVLPHPRAHLRGFVMQPLAEICPEFILPGQTLPAKELARKLPPSTACA